MVLEDKLCLLHKEFTQWLEEALHLFEFAFPEQHWIPRDFLQKPETSEPYDERAVFLDVSAQYLGDRVEAQREAVVEHTHQVQGQFFVLGILQ